MKKQIIIDLGYDSLKRDSVILFRCSKNAISTPPEDKTASPTHNPRNLLHFKPGKTMKKELDQSYKPLYQIPKKLMNYFIPCMDEYWQGKNLMEARYGVD